jgi:hypothetical protein
VSSECYRAVNESETQSTVQGNPRSKQRIVTGTYPEPDESNPHFNIILPSTHANIKKQKIMKSFT